MLEIPVIRWGKPYSSMSQEPVVHFETGEPLGSVHQANGGMIGIDLKRAQRARDILRQFSIADLCQKAAAAADLYLEGTLAVGNGQQSPADFCRIQSASTGLPEAMCAANMKKNAFVLKNMTTVIDALTRGLDPAILTRGFGIEKRGVTVSYQAYSPVLGAVLPSNSPGVHTLWMPVLPLQIGLVLKPGSSEPWTPYRIFAALTQAGIPPEVISLYPGGHDCGPAVLEGCARSLVFGGQATVDKYHGDPRVQAHGPGFSKILFGDDMVDDWEKHVDLMVDSVFLNSGRSCINCSGIWVSRHGREIAERLAQRLGPVKPLPMTDPQSPLAAFTTAGVAPAMNTQINELLKTPGATEMTARHRDGERLIQHERCDFLRPTVIYCESPDHPLANTEYMFPFVSVVECPQAQMIKRIGKTLIGSAITADVAWGNQLLDAVHIDRLNLGPIPNNAINWMQPHEGNLIEFLFRARAVQTAGDNFRHSVA